MRYTENLVAAAAPKKFNTPSGRYFLLESILSGVVTVNFSKNGKKLPEEIVAVPGRDWWSVFGRSDASPDFDEVTLESTTTQDVVFYISRGGVGSNVAGTVQIQKASVIDTVADVALNNGSSTVVLAADSTRRHAIISALAANTQNIRVGDSAVTGTRGAELQPGQSILLEGTEEIRAFAGAAGQSVGVTIVKD